MDLVYGFHRIAFVRLPLPSARVDDDRSAPKPFQDRVMRLFAVVDHFSRAGQNAGVRRRLLLARLPEARCFEQALPFKNDDIIHRNCLLGFHPLRAIESFSNSFKWRYRLCKKKNSKQFRTSVKR